MALDIIHRYCLPEPVRQFPVDIGRELIHIDLPYPRPKVGNEADSYAWHMDRRAFEGDRERDIALQRLGWVVLRFTYAKLRYDEQYVASAIAEQLRARAHIEW